MALSATSVSFSPCYAYQFLMLNPVVSHGLFTYLNLSPGPSHLSVYLNSFHKREIKDWFSPFLKCNPNPILHKYLYKGSECFSSFTVFASSMVTETITEEGALPCPVPSTEHYPKVCIILTTLGSSSGNTEGVNKTRILEGSIYHIGTKDHEQIQFLITLYLYEAQS